jgi:hypothetical protein
MRELLRERSEAIARDKDQATHFAQTSAAARRPARFD